MRSSTSDLSMSRREQSQQTGSLLDDLVCEREQPIRHGETEHPGSGGVDDEFELGRLHDRKVGGLRALQDAANINADLVLRVAHARPIAHEPARFGVGLRTSDRGNGVSGPVR
jgi:hypothetical protein